MQYTHLKYLWSFLDPLVLALTSFTDEKELRNPGVRPPGCIGYKLVIVNRSCLWLFFTGKLTPFNTGKNAPPTLSQGARQNPEFFGWLLLYFKCSSVNVQEPHSVRQIIWRRRVKHVCVSVAYNKKRYKHECGSMEMDIWREAEKTFCVCVSGDGGWFAGNYTTIWTVISVRKNKGTAMLGTWDAGEDGGGLACVIYEFCPGQEDQWWMIKK